MSPRTAVDTEQTAMVNVITPPFLDYLGSICLYLITNIIRKH